MAHATCNSTYTWYYWAKNSFQQDPCTVASILLAPCPGNPSVLPLTLPSTSYPAPTTSTQSICTCSYVIYNLLAACSDCQVGTLAPNAWPSYSNWTTHCSSSNLRSSYPLAVPSNTTIPIWATMTSSDSGDSHWSYGLSYALARGSVIAANESDPSTQQPPPSPVAPDQVSCTSPKRLAAVSGASGAAGIVIGAAALALILYLYTRYQGRHSLQPTLFSKPKSTGPSGAISTSSRRGRPFLAQQPEPPVQPFHLNTISSPSISTPRKLAIRAEAAHVQDGSPSSKPTRPFSQMQDQDTNIQQGATTTIPVEPS